MAARVNTKFVLIVVLTVGVVMALLGGVYVLKLRGDATRSARKGQEAWDRGDYKAALDQFGRALHKDPGNAEYLRRADEALLKLVPNNAGEARELYFQRLNMLTHGVLHNPTSPEVHLRLLEELHASARRVNTAHEWQTVIQAAENMMQQVPDDAGRGRAKVYRAMGIGRLTSQRTETELAQALDDLELAIIALGPDDMAWAAKIAGRLALIGKLEVVGRARSIIDEARTELEKLVVRALEEVPNGPETAKAVLIHRLQERSRNRSSETDAAVRAAADHLMALLAAGSEPGLVYESSSILELVPENGMERAATVLERALAADPGRHDLRLQLASLRLRMGDLSGTEEHANRVIEAPQLSVSLLAQQQFDLRRYAASLLSDVEYQRWESAPADEKAAQLEKAVQARDRLAGFVADVTADGLMLRTDARLALARGEVAEAAQKFEQLVRLTDEKDVESLIFASIALGRINQLGLAYERITQAAELAPAHTPLRVEKANLELMLARPEDAKQTLAPLTEADLATPRAAQVAAAVRRALGGEAPPATDPVQAAMQQAKEAMDKNDIDNARAGLLAALDGHPDAALLLGGLAQVEIASGQRDEARKYVDRGLKAHPNHPMLRQLDMSLRYEDPVQATLEYVKAAVPEAKAQAEQALVTMSNIYEQQRLRAEQLQRQGQAEESAKAGSMSQRAMAEADRAAGELERLDPQNARLLDYRFNMALASKDWAEVDRLQARARELNLDAAGGLVYKGRAEVVRGNYRDAVASLEQASEKLSFSSAVWRLLAVAYQNLGNFAQAERAYEQAYRCNPNDVAGARAYIGILQRRGDKSRALEILQGVCRLAPNDLMLREAWLTLEAEVGSKAVALRERQTIHEASPDDQENAAALAMLLATTTPTRELIWNDEDQPLYSEERWKSLRGTEREQTINSTRERWRHQSESIIDALGKTLGDDLRVASLRARVRKEGGDILAGEIILREFIDRRDPTARSEDMFVELGRYQAAINHYTEAVESVQQAVALNGPKQREARINLAMLLMQLRRHEEALTSLEAALAAKDDQGVRLQIIECLINLRRFDEAEQRLNESSLAVGGSMTTLLAASVAEGRAHEQIAKGQVAAAERHVAQQRDLLSKAETQDPGNPLPRILMAQSLFHEYQRTQRPSLLDDAMAALDRADRIRAGSADTAAMRVAILQARGDRQGAITQLRHMLEINPDNIAARRDLIQMHIDVHDAPGAAAEIEAAIQQNPTIAAWHELRGDLVVRSGGDPGQATAAFARAHDLQPDNGILLKLVSALMLSKPPNCQAAAERLAQQIEIDADDPVLHEAHAQALGCMGRRDQAIEQLRIAYAGRVKAPQIMRDAHTSASWFVALGSVYTVEQTAEAESLVMDLCGGKPSVRELREMARLWHRAPSGLNRALELQRQAVTLCPPEESDLRASVNYDLASFLLASGDVRGAAEAYDIVLRIQPANVSALNNLAYVRAEELDDAPAALPLADRLLQLAPKQAPVLDTVGWVYFKNGDLEKAREYLQQSVTIQPAIDTYVHLATVAAKMGDGAGAENQLKEAEKMRPDAKSQQKIKAVRDDIEKSRPSAPSQPMGQAGSDH